MFYNFLFFIQCFDRLEVVESTYSIMKNTLSITGSITGMTKEEIEEMNETFPYDLVVQGRKD